MFTGKEMVREDEPGMTVCLHWHVVGPVKFGSFND